MLLIEIICKEENLLQATNW